MTGRIRFCLISIDFAQSTSDLEISILACLIWKESDLHIFFWIRGANCAEYTQQVISGVTQESKRNLHVYLAAWVCRSADNSLSNVTISVILIEEPLKAGI